MPTRVLYASTHAFILFFTTTGKVFWIKVHELPQAGRAARGKAIVNLLHLQPDEKVSAFLPIREFEENRYVVFATRNGTVPDPSWALISASFRIDVDFGMRREQHTVMVQQPIVSGQ